MCTFIQKQVDVVVLLKTRHHACSKVHSLNYYYAYMHNNNPRIKNFYTSVITLLCIAKEVLFKQTTLNKQRYLFNCFNHLYAFPFDKALWLPYILFTLLKDKSLFNNSNGSKSAEITTLIFEATKKKPLSSCAV